MSKHPNHLSYFRRAIWCIWLPLCFVVNVRSCHCIQSFIRSLMYLLVVFFSCPVRIAYTHTHTHVVLCLLFSYSYLLQFYGVLLWCTEYTVGWYEQKCLYMWYLMWTRYTASILVIHTSIAKRTVSVHVCCMCACGDLYVFMFSLLFLKKSVFPFGFSIIF